MSFMIKQSQTLEELRLADFERTQLLDLKTEISALESLYSILSPVLRNVPNSTPVWNFHGRWYEVLWLSLYPFLQWLALFSGVIADAGVRRHATLFKMRFRIVRWLFLVVTAPVLGLLTILWNLAYYYVPSVIFTLLHAGAYFTISEDMIHNVNVTEALDCMANSQQSAYNQSIAELLLLVSAITYTRDSEGYAKAQQIYRNLVTKLGRPLPTAPVLSEHAGPRSTILSALEYSETIMRKYASTVDMQVAVISELDSGFGGPAASFFASNTHGVLIVAVRGTNPFDAREILVDAAFDKVPVRKEYFAFLRGSKTKHMHRGFYSSLFPLDGSEHYPARRLVAAIKEKARVMIEATPSRNKIHVYITGHSLGAAIASILSASIGDLGAQVQLHDAYLYGTPMSSDAAFCTAYRQETRSKIWRVINQRDFVTKIPPSINVLASDGGVGEMMDADKIFDGSILDYSAVGYGIRYRNNGHLPDGLRGTKFVSNAEPVSKARAVWWIRLLEQTPCRSIVQHSPRSYSVVLKNARASMMKYSASL